MKPVMLALILVGLSLLAGQGQARETVTLRASDGLEVTADVYRLKNAAADAPWIVLAHQAGSSRGEYRTIAPRLNELGFNAIALDQRSGGTFAGVKNETAALAKKKRLARSYVAALPDIKAGLRWAREQTSGKVILWGSSYSAALALLIAGETPQAVDAVLSMSPGEYIRGRSVRKAARAITAPVFITSAANETRRWKALLAAVPHANKTGFAPPRGGRHGSSALIAARNASSEVYWAQVNAFLKTYAK